MNHFMKHITMGTVLGLAMLVGGIGQANATLLLGQDIQTSVKYPDKVTVVGSAVTKTVLNPGVEYSSLSEFFVLPPNNPDASIDLTDTQIFIAVTKGGGFLSGGFNGLHFFAVSPTIPNWTVSVSVNTFTGFNPLTMLDFDANNIFVNVQGLTLKTGERLVLDIAAAPVPEPSTMLLFGSGLAGLVAWRVRKPRA